MRVQLFPLVFNCEKLFFKKRLFNLSIFREKEEKNIDLCIYWLILVCALTRH